MKFSDVEDLLGQDEGRLLEFKRDWHSLDTKRGRAELCKDILALANSLKRGEYGWLIFGVGDRATEEGIPGVENPPQPERRWCMAPGGVAS